MISTRINIALVILIAVAWNGCSYEFPSVEPQPTLETGNANFDRIAVLGGSISAGFMDGALYNEGQEYAYMALIGAKLEEEFSNEFYSTLKVNSENGQNFEAETIFQDKNGRYELRFRNPQISYPARIPVDGEPLQDFSAPLSGIANYSIPNIRITEFDNATALAENPYFDRLKEREENESILDLIIQRNPTLIIFQPGIADLFDYVLAGASGDENPSPDAVGENDLIPVSVFDQMLNKILERILMETEADVFLTTLPDPLKLPYANSIPSYFTVEDIERINADLSYMTKFNNDVQNYNRTTDLSEYRPTIGFSTLGGNRNRGLIIVDEYLPEAFTEDGTEIPKWRQLTFDEFILYNAENIHYKSLQTDVSFGTSIPLNDKYVLTITEQEIIKKKQETYNEIIKKSADSSPRIHLLDFGTLIDEIAEGKVYYDGVSYTNNFSSKTIISADGYTLNPRGHALLANLLLQLINKQFSASIPLLNVNSYRSNIIKNEF